jgi:thioredoxin:protein disulfide reductase
MALSARQRGGHWLGAAVMGLLSSLAIGPCVTAPMAGALIYIGQTGDAWLGGGALFCLGLGMGVPLLAIGTTAGKWLPKSGNWMKITQYLFGFGLLAVAVWLLGRVFPTEINRWLWLSLLILPLIYLARRGFWQAMAACAVMYSLLTTLNWVTDQQREYLQSLCVAALACEKPPALPFQKIASIAELNQALEAAQSHKQWLILDVYADWCVACQEMELYTFTDDRVKAMLAKTRLLQADVTSNDAEQHALMKKFELIGPPAVLFFAPDRQEQTAQRVIGFVDSERFLAQLGRVLH